MPHKKNTLHRRREQLRSNLSQPRVSGNRHCKLCRKRIPKEHWLTHLNGHLAVFSYPVSIVGDPDIS